MGLWRVATTDRERILSITTRWPTNAGYDVGSQTKSSLKATSCESLAESGCARRLAVLVVVLELVLNERSTCDSTPQSHPLAWRARRAAAPGAGAPSSRHRAACRARSPHLPSALPALRCSLTSRGTESSAVSLSVDGALLGGGRAATRQRPPWRALGAEKTPPSANRCAGAARRLAATRPPPCPLGPGAEVGALPPCVAAEQPPSPGAVSLRRRLAPPDARAWR